MEKNEDIHSYQVKRTSVRNLNDMSRETEKKRLRCNRRQLQMLAEFMTNHDQLNSGEFSGPLGRKKAVSQWQKLKELLKEYGPDKSIEQWKQTWKDLKKNGRAKNSVLIQEYSAPDDAADVPVVSHNVSKKVLNTIKQECPVETEESDIGLMAEINEIKLLLAERNALLREQNSLLSQSNRIARRKRFTR